MGYHRHSTPNSAPEMQSTTIWLANDTGCVCISHICSQLQEKKAKKVYHGIIPCVQVYYWYVLGVILILFLRTWLHATRMRLSAGCVWNVAWCVQMAFMSPTNNSSSCTFAEGYSTWGWVLCYTGLHRWVDPCVSMLYPLSLSRHRDPWSASLSAQRWWSTIKQATRLTSSYLTMSPVNPAKLAASSGHS